MAGKTWTALGLLAVAVLTGLPGCSGGGKQFSVNDRVEGTVTLEGTPLANVFVQFVPDIDPKFQAPTSEGFTDDKGNFKLAFTPEKSGAVVGKNYVVVIRGRGTAGGADDRDPQARQVATGPAVPEAYRLAAKTPLLVNVTADQHTYELKLSRSAGPRPAK
jgi:hypothetical protein